MKKLFILVFSLAIELMENVKLLYYCGQSCCQFPLLLFNSFKIALFILFLARMVCIPR